MWAHINYKSTNNILLNLTILTLQPALRQNGITKATILRSKNNHFLFLKW